MESYTSAFTTAYNMGFSAMLATEHILVDISLICYSSRVTNHG